MQIPQSRIDWLKNISELQGIPVEKLQKYYSDKINDPTVIAAFPNEEDLLGYVDNLLGTFIQEFHSAVMTKYEIVVFGSSGIKTSKAGNLYNNHVVMARLPTTDGTPKAWKWMNIQNFQETGKVEKLPMLATGTITVNVKSENDIQIDAQTRTNTEFIPCEVAGIPTKLSEKIDWMKKSARQFTIATAGQNLSAKTQDQKGVNPCSLRWIQGTIATHKITKKADEKTGIERTTGIITITDKSVVMIPDFGKSKQVADPKNPGKTITEYGGFSAFCDPEDIKEIGRGSDCVFVGTLTTPRQMNVIAIHPILAIAPKKPSEKLQKPSNQSAPSTPVDASVNAASI